MITIDLSIYLKTTQYFKLFDILLKDETITKEAFLIEHGITPSSYRRARLQEVNVGSKIIEKLSTIYGYKTLEKNQILEIEKRLNDIHSKVYFKIYDTFDEDLEYVNSLIEKKNLLYPVFRLFLLFMFFNKNVSSIKIIEDEEEAFKEIKKFKDFYSDSLLEIYDFIECAFMKVIPQRIKEKTDAYPMVYQVLAAKYSNEYKYFESNYFAEKAIDIYIHDGNYKRAYFAMLPLLFNLNQLGNYEEVFRISHNHILMLQSFKYEELDYNPMIKHLVVSGFALKKYDFIIELLEKRKQLNYTESTAWLAAVYLTNKTKYESYMKEYNYQDLDDSNQNKHYLKNLDLYLKTKDKNALKALSSFEIYETLITLLKKI